MDDVQAKLSIGSNMSLSNIILLAFTFRWGFEDSPVRHWHVQYCQLFTDSSWCFRALPTGCWPIHFANVMFAASQKNGTLFGLSSLDI